MSETTTKQIDEAADLRGVLLAALSMGEWEAEHLSGLALARRLAALHLAAQDRLQAQSTQMQRLACDVQELLSGEEYERLREELYRIGEEVVALAAENARLRGGLLRVLRLADLAADALDGQGIPHYGLGDVARLAREALGDAAASEEVDQ